MPTLSANVLNDKWIWSWVHMQNEHQKTSQTWLRRAELRLSSHNVHSDQFAVNSFRTRMEEKLLVCSSWKKSHKNGVNVSLIRSDGHFHFSNCLFLDDFKFYYNFRKTNLQKVDPDVHFGSSSRLSGWNGSFRQTNNAQSLIAMQSNIRCETVNNSLWGITSRDIRYKTSNSEKFSLHMKSHWSRTKEQLQIRSTKTLLCEFQGKLMSIDTRSHTMFIPNLHFTEAFC